jgi:hypothetical protein
MSTCICLEVAWITPARCPWFDLVRLAASHGRPQRAMILRARALSLFSRGVRTQARYDYTARESPELIGGWPSTLPSLATPRQVRGCTSEFERTLTMFVIARAIS